MNYLKISLCILSALSVSRFVPHPPNFTSLLALSFYVPALLGARYIPALILSFLITDFFIGFHSTFLFTWGSVVVIGLFATHFNHSILRRISGALMGATIFFIISNFGVWTGGSYGYSFNGFLAYFEQSKVSLEFGGKKLLVYKIMVINYLKFIIKYPILKFYFKI